MFPRHYNGDPAPPGPDVPYIRPPKATKAYLFKKGIKRDITAFPTLKQDTPFDAWKQQTITQAHAQDCGEIITLTYQPDTQEDQDKFALKQIFMYSVFAKHLLSNKGKELVWLHENDFNAQAIFFALVDHHTTATLGDVGD